MGAAPATGTTVATIATVDTVDTDRGRYLRSQTVARSAGTTSCCGEIPDATGTTVAAVADRAGIAAVPAGATGSPHTTGAAAATVAAVA